MFCKSTSDRNGEDDINVYAKLQCQCQIKLLQMSNYGIMI